MFFYLIFSILLIPTVTRLQEGLRSQVWDVDKQTTWLQPAWRAWLQLTNDLAETYMKGLAAAYMRDLGVAHMKGLTDWLHIQNVCYCINIKQLNN